MKLTRALPKAWRLLTSATVRRQALNAVDAYFKLHPMVCTICGFKGRFNSSADTPIGSVCAGCGSWERHRLFALALERGVFSVAGKTVLNCSPEKEIWETVNRAGPKSHQRVARRLGHGGAALFVEEMDAADASVDLFVAVHSFEHCDDDRRAIAEVHRVLKPEGRLVAMVPLIEGWSETHEDPSIESLDDRQLHFGHWDHLRYYGADFRRRLEAAGFALSEFTAGPTDSTDHGLIRGEKVFLAIKQAAAP
jgi:SAM-dependent methyltransferase